MNPLIRIPSQEFLSGTKSLIKVIKIYMDLRPSLQPLTSNLTTLLDAGRHFTSPSRPVRTLVPGIRILCLKRTEECAMVARLANHPPLGIKRG